MTTAALTPAIDYLEDGATVAFSVPFRFNSPSDIQAQREDADGVFTTLTYGADYSVTGGSTDAGGTLTVAAAAASGTKLHIWRETARDQQTDYETGDSFPAASHEEALDKLTLQMQENDSDLARSLKFPRGESPYTLPAAVQRLAGRIFGFDSTTGAPTLLAPGDFKGEPGSPGEAYGSRVALATAGATAADRDDAYLSEPGRAGKFLFTSDDISAEVALDTMQGVFIARSDDATGATGGWVRAFEGPMLPEWFGAAGDDETDDGAALQVVFDLISTTRPLVELRNFYRTSTQLSVWNKHRFAIIGRGRIKATDDMPSASGYQTLFIDDCTRFYLEGFEIDGNRAERGGLETPAHSIELRSCRYYIVNGIRSVDAICDCLYLSCASAEITDRSLHNQDALFISCVFERGFRQGTSVIQGRNIRFLLCTFMNTGFDADGNADGTAPLAGVDLESNSGDLDGALEDIHFIGCTFEWNAGYGALVASEKTPRGVTFTNCLFRDNVKGAVSWQGKRGALVDCTFEGFDGNTATRGMVDIGAASDAGWLQIVRPRILDMTNMAEGKKFLYVHSGSGGHVDLIDTHEAILPYIANLAGARCRVIRGRFTGSKSNAISLINSGCSVIDARAENYEYDFIRVTSARARVFGCELINATLNNSNGAVRCFSGYDHQIRATTFRQSAPGTFYAIQAGSGCAIELIEGNAFENVSNPVTVASGGAAIGKRNNRRSIEQTLTATGDSSSVQLAGDILVKVTPSGTITGKVQESADGVSWSDTAGGALTGAATLTFAGASKYWRVNISAMTGTCAVRLAGDMV